MLDRKSVIAFQIERTTKIKFKNIYIVLFTEMARIGWEQSL